MKTKLTLHIGISKTGTTLLQSLLVNEGIQAALKLDDLKFSPLGFDIWEKIFKIDPGSEDIRLLKWNEMIKSGSFAITPQMCDQLRDYLTTHDFSEASGYVASQEGLSDIYLYLSQQNQAQQLVSFLDVLKSFFDIKIIAFVRRQDHFAESFYAHSVRRGYTEDFDTFIANFPCGHMKWDRLIAFFADTFGTEDICVLPFEKPLLEKNLNQNMADSFMKACGIQSNINYGVLPVTNPSMAPFAIPIALHANRTLEYFQSYQVNNALANGCAKPPGTAFDIFSDEKRLQFLDTYADSNKTLFEKYMPQFPVDSYSTTGNGGL
jgi:hypothetical protein